MEVVESDVALGELEVLRVDVCRYEAPSWPRGAGEERVDAGGTGAAGGVESVCFTRGGRIGQGNREEGMKEGRENEKREKGTVHVQADHVAIGIVALGESRTRAVEEGLEPENIVQSARLSLQPLEFALLCASIPVWNLRPLQVSTDANLQRRAARRTGGHSLSSGSSTWRPKSRFSRLFVSCLGSRR